MNIREKAEYSRQSYQNHRLTLWLKRHELAVIGVVILVTAVLTVINGVGGL